jgi:hypothetical protein
VALPALAEKVNDTAQNDKNSPTTIDNQDFDQLDNIDHKKKSEKNQKWKEAKADTILPGNPKIRKDILLQGLVKPEKSSFFETYSVEGGLHGSPILPMDLLKNSFSMGLGGTIFASMDFPFLPNSRLGISIGYASMNSKISYFDAKITLIPMVFYYEIYYIFFSAIRPYLRLGSGATYSSYKGKSMAETSYSSVSSFDATMDFGIGIGYRPRFIKKVEFILYANYFRAFESNSNSFMLVSLGTNIIF